MRGNFMPWTSTALIVLIIAVALVVALLVWKGRGGKFVRKNGTWEASVNEKAPDIKVAAGIHVGKEGQAGNITGAEGQNLRVGDVDVANHAKIEGKVGDITGVKTTGSDKKNADKPKSGK